ncbi:alpha-mannosidase [Niallia sp.]|uniref:alpha-mannosidase n=1 Tax=Niallia sp. TaxID=2837523 RepID=UPI002897C16D|nr:alpha-mannosidase [Niallia sp.]
MKKVYIISHSHWDREWYLPFEQHRMRLVQLIDDLLELFEIDPHFDSFHLDGQTIILDDYLEVKPQNEWKLKKYIQEGKLKIGPFYILQDDFLISSESNVRNLLIGLQECRKWGSPVKLGYFPDTFGNMGQAPQILQQSGMDVAAFGRGVKPTGFNNIVINDDQYSSPFSEMWWEGPDKSSVLGILFANWYSNGNEIPVEEVEAKQFWDQKLKDALQYASTEHLLFMNGCDHQPVQKNITKAIEVANALYPDITFIHSSFDEYMKILKQDIPENLHTVKGELTSQETDGWYTLANTASARVYLKQRNTDVSRLLENVAEPLAAMAYQKEGEYPHEMFQFSWKQLMQNHPHDSICGCCVDEVHREMMTRFHKAEEVGQFIKKEAMNRLAEQVDTSYFPDESRPFIVFNTAGSAKTGSVEIEIEWKRLPFSSGRPDELYRKLKAEELPTIKVIDEQGVEIPARLICTDIRFGYDLPEDRFRQPFIGAYVTVELLINQMSPLSWKTYALIEGESQQRECKRFVQNNGQLLENDHVKVEIEQNGTLTIWDKATNSIYTNFLVFESTGDVGNEYIYKMPKGDQPILSSAGTVKIEVLADTFAYGEVLLTQKMIIPESADERLSEEQKGLIEFRERNAGRSKKLKTLELKTKIRLESNSNQLLFETSFDNQMKDHRLRVLFPTGIHVDEHEADSVFEVVKRPNKVNSGWENPTNPQHQHAFVNLHDGHRGVTVANYGLNEYEIVEDTIAVTLLRAVGELGDWGYFPTPEAQCQGRQTVKFAVGFHDSTNKLESYHAAINFQIPFSSVQTDIHKGTYPSTYEFIQLDGKAFRLTAFKQKENSKEIVLRGYNLTGEKQPLSVACNGKYPSRSNLLEEMNGELFDSHQMKEAEICTFVWE